MLWLRSSPTTKRVIDPPGKSQRNYIINARFHTAWVVQEQVQSPAFLLGLVKYGRVKYNRKITLIDLSLTDAIVLAGSFLLIVAITATAYASFLIASAYFDSRNRR